MMVVGGRLFGCLIGGSWLVWFGLVVLDDRLILAFSKIRLWLGQGAVEAVVNLWFRIFIFSFGVRNVVCSNREEFSHSFIIFKLYVLRFDFALFLGLALLWYGLVLVLVYWHSRCTITVSRIIMKQSFISERDKSNCINAFQNLKFWF